MKILIVGSRKIESFDLSEYVPKSADLIISGGASGIDSVAEAYADKHRISKLIMRPKYNLYGKSAPLKRNEQMVDLADLVIVVWDGVSRGTKHTLDYAKKRGKQLILLMQSNND